MALCVRRADQAAEELAGLPEAAALGGKGTTLFAEAPAEGARDLYRRLPAGHFDRIVVSPSLRLFDAPWTLGLVRNLNGALRRGGTIVLPVASDPGKGFLGLATLQRWFRGEGSTVGSRHVEFERSGSLPAAASLIEWMLDERDALTADLASSSGWSDEEAEEMVRYWIQGLSYKAPLVGAIVRDRMNGRNGLRLADVGGGPGFVAAELLLDPDLGLDSAVNVDHSTPCELLATRLAHRFSDQLANRFEFAFVPMQEYDFDSGFDLVTFFAALTYCPKGARSGVLERAWGSLRPGGALVLLENIKSPQYSRDYDLMFEAEELDELLGRFGPVEYMAATAAVSLQREQVQNRTVFRIASKR